MMQIADNRPRRPALRYTGGSWRTARKIISYIPAGHDLYAEPYGGGMSVMLSKPRSSIEIYNDLDEDVVNYFQVLRTRPEELIAAIRFTPFAETELKNAIPPADDLVERARRLYIRSFMSIEGATSPGRNGFHYRRQVTYSRNKKGNAAMTPAAASFADVDHLYTIAERLRGVQIWKMPALDLIQRCDGPQAVFYIDPPFVLSTRKSKKYYNHEMSDKDHRQLADVLHSCKAMVLLNGYDCELYQELLGDWKRVDFQTRVNGQGNRTESLWLNPAVIEALAAEIAELERNYLPLFARMNNEKN